MKITEMILSVLQAQDDNEDYLICVDRIGQTVSFELETFAERLVDSLMCWPTGCAQSITGTAVTRAVRSGAGQHPG